MKLVLATKNEKKRRELEEILGRSGVQVVLQWELGVEIDVEETGGSFAENAQLKADAVCLATGLPALADDSGLVVDALDGAPGIYSARYGGEGLDDEGRYRLLLKEMEGKDKRSCRFVCAICCSFPDGTRMLSEGTCEGELATVPCGEDGFGYDPVFYLPRLGKTMAQLSAEKKHSISHRGVALQLFQREWENKYGTDQ